MSAHDEHEDERYLVDADGPVDPEVARLEGLLGRYRHAGEGPPDVERGSPRPGPRGFLVSPRLLQAGIAAAAIFVATMLLIDFLTGDRGEPERGRGWAVAGAPGVERLARGDWLEATGDEIELTVGEIGEVALEAGARVRLDDPGDEVHALFLERGRVRATINAEPREFQIGTPAGVSVDMGCVYTLGVGDDEASELLVEWGLVAFESEGRTVFVPEGYATRAELDAGPRLPVPVKWSSDEAAAARRLAEARNPSTADLAVLEQMTDPVVLYHLVRAASPVIREPALDAVLLRESLPAGVTREDVLSDPSAWEAWHEELSWMPFLRTRGTKGTKGR